MSLDLAKRSSGEQAPQTSSEEKDTATLIVGSKGSGKTSLLATLKGSSKGNEGPPQWIGPLIISFSG